METERKGQRIPKGIWALGFVSLLMDVSSEMIHSVLPLFLVSGLGASAIAVGWIEGVAEAIASCTKIFSGALSDYLGKRKPLAIFGYGLAALSKPFFALANSVGLVAAARFSDRVGKGIRGAPRDALIADIAPPDIRGACFGLRQSLDTLGALLGPLAAFALMALCSGNYRLVFWLAVIPASASVVLLVLGVKEPERNNAAMKSQRFFSGIKQLSGSFWLVVAAGAVLTAARFSEAFLLLRGPSVGVAVAFVPLVMAAMNLSYTLSAYPAGWLSDRMSKRYLLELGFAVLIASDLVLTFATGPLTLFIGALLWGLHMGLTQGLLSALVAASAPAELRGSAFGIFHFTSGISLLLASVLAGYLWSEYGPGAAFLGGACITAAGLCAFMFRR